MRPKRWQLCARRVWVWRAENRDPGRARGAFCDYQRTSGIRIEFPWADFWVAGFGLKTHPDVAVAHDGPGTGTVVLSVGAGWVRPREKSKMWIIGFHGW